MGDVELQREVGRVDKVVNMKSEAVGLLSPTSPRRDSFRCLAMVAVVGNRAAV